MAWKVGRLSLSSPVHDDRLERWSGSGDTDDGGRVAALGRAHCSLGLPVLVGWVLVDLPLSCR